MDIFKIIIICIISTLTAIVLKQYKPEYALITTVVTGVIVFLSVTGKINEIFMFVTDLCTEAGLNTDYINVLFKITGICYLCEFSQALCIDAGENAMAFKIDIAGKIALIYLSMPVFFHLLEIIKGISF